MNDAGMHLNEKTFYLLFHAKGEIAKLSFFWEIIKFK